MNLSWDHPYLIWHDSCVIDFTPGLCYNCYMDLPLVNLNQEQLEQVRQALTKRCGRWRVFLLEDVSGFAIMDSLGVLTTLPTTVYRSIWLMESLKSQWTQATHLQEMVDFRREKAGLKALMQTSIKVYLEEHLSN